MTNNKELAESTESGSLYTRLFRGVGAQSYSQVVQLIIRLAEVPLLLHFWNPELYGEWLILSAVPAYLGMGDIGFSATAAREMTLLNSANDKDGALQVFQSTWILLIALSISIFLGTIAFVEIAPLGHWLGLKQINNASLNIIVIILMVDVLIGFQSSLLSGALWAVGHYPLGIGLSATMQLFGFLGLAFGLFFNNNPIYAASGYLLGKVLSLFILWGAQKRLAPGFHYGFRHATWQEIRRLWVPSLASLAFPLGNAFNIQGIRVILGTILGPSAVAVFVPLRTLANLAMQPRRIVNQLLQPELGIAYGNKDNDLFKRLVLKASQLAFWGTLLVAIVLAAIGGKVLSYWTSGKIPMHWSLFLLLLLSVVVNALWYTALMVPYATNRHSRIAALYAGIYGGVAFLLVFIFTHFYNMEGTGLALLLVEAIMANFVIREALRLSDLNFSTWFIFMIHPPIETLKRAYSRFLLLFKTSVN